MTSSVPLDPDMEVLVRGYDALVAKTYDKVLFRTAVALDSSVSCVRYRETAVADWMCDACVCTPYSLQHNLKADMCLLSGYTFSECAVVPPGDLTMGHLMSIFPESVKLIVSRLSGREIHHILEVGAGELPNECGGLIHVSRELSYTIHVTTEQLDPRSGEMFREANWVDEVYLDGFPLDWDRHYVVCLTDAMVKEGGFRSPCLGNAVRVVDEECAPQLHDVVMAYCAKSAADGARCPANPTGGRITITTDDEVACDPSCGVQ